MNHQGAKFGNKESTLAVVACASLTGRGWNQPTYVIPALSDKETEG